MNETETDIDIDVGTDGIQWVPVLFVVAFIAAAIYALISVQSISRQASPPTHAACQGPISSQPVGCYR